MDTDKLSYLDAQYILNQAEDIPGMRVVTEELYRAALEDLEELLDALQGIHNRNERYGRSVRIKLLIKHGRIQE